MHMYFRVWSTNNTLMSVAAQFRKQVELLLQQNTDDMNKAKQLALAALREALATEQRSREIQLRRDFDEELHNALSAAEEQKNKELQDARAERRATFNSTWKALAQKEKKMFASWKNGNNEKSTISEKSTESHLNRLKEALAEKEREMNAICNQKLSQQAVELGDK
eukprot:gene29034-38422_t